MATKRIYNRPPSELNAEQKIALAILSFLGVGGIIFGFRSFGSHLYRPIQMQIAKYYTGQDVLSLNDPEAQIAEQQKKKDSDGDGVSDYDELYIYHTSAYLKDSDSDGLDDKGEIFGGTDPNCPEGKDCSNTAMATNPEELGKNTVAQDLLSTTNSNAADIVNAGKMKFNSKEEAAAFFKSATVKEIREALIQSGADKEKIDALTDTQLQDIYNTAVNQSITSGDLEKIVNQTTSETSSASSSNKVP